MTTEFNPKSMTHSGLERFAQLVEMAIEAEWIDPRQRMKLICVHAYDYANPDAIDNMEAGIKRAQGVEREFVTMPSGFQRVVF